MNIAIFTNNYLPNPFGVSTSIESFRIELEKMGHKVYIFAPMTKGFVDENKFVFRYPAIDLEFRGIRFPLAIPFSNKVGRILKELEIDVIHSQHPNLLGWAAKRWAKKKGVPLVFTWHTLYDQYAHFAPAFVPRKFAQWWTISNAVRYANGADQVVVPTPSVGRIIKKWGVKNKNIVAIPTGVDEKNFQGANSEIVREKFGISGEKIVILLHSRLTEEKNIFFVFDCVENVLKKNSEAVFIISGNGNLVEPLREKVKERGIENQTFFIQPQKREELKNIYASADVFVCGSRSETQGTVISEALYMGLPVVAISATGVKDMVTNHVTGLLVEDNKGEFESAVVRMIENSELRRKFSENAKRIAKEQFTSIVCSKKMIELYKEVIKKKIEKEK